MWYEHRNWWLLLLYLYFPTYGKLKKRLSRCSSSPHRPLRRDLKPVRTTKKQARGCNIQCGIACTYTQHTKLHVLLMKTHMLVKYLKTILERDMLNS